MEGRREVRAKGIHGTLAIDLADDDPRSFGHLPNAVHGLLRAKNSSDPSGGREFQGQARGFNMVLIFDVPYDDLYNNMIYCNLV